MFERIRSQLHWRLSLVLMVLFVLFALLAGLILRQFSISYEQEVVQRHQQRCSDVYRTSANCSAHQPKLDHGRWQSYFRYVMIVNQPLTCICSIPMAACRVMTQARPSDAATSAAGTGVLVLAWSGSAADPRCQPAQRVRHACFQPQPVGIQRGRPVMSTRCLTAQRPAIPRSPGQLRPVRRAAVVRGRRACFWGHRRVAVSLADRATAPARTARRSIRSGSLRRSAAAPTATRGGDELARLAQAFDAMAAKIAAQFAQIESIDLNRREAVLKHRTTCAHRSQRCKATLQTLQIKADELSAEQRASYITIAQRQPSA